MCIYLCACAAVDFGNRIFFQIDLAIWCILHGSTDCAKINIRDNNYYWILHTSPDSRTSFSTYYLLFPVSLETIMHLIESSFNLKWLKCTDAAKCRLKRMTVLIGAAYIYSTFDCCSFLFVVWRALCLFIACWNC